MTEKNQYIGISLDKCRPDTPYRCRVRIDNKIHYVGRFKTKELALVAKENYIKRFRQKQDETSAQYYKLRNG